MTDVKLPKQDIRLLNFFCGNDLEPRSLHGSFKSMSETSFARGLPDSDGRIINSGAVSFNRRSEHELAARTATLCTDPEVVTNPFKSDRISKSSKHRATKDLLEQLEPRDVKILCLAYGPQDQIPYLKLGPILPVGKENNEEIAGRAKRELLGDWRQVLPETFVLVQAHHAWVCDPDRKGETLGFLRWLVEIVTRKSEIQLLTAGTTEAHQLVKKAYGAWIAVRGKQRQLRGKVRFDRGEEPTDWLTGTDK